MAADPLLVETVTRLFADTCTHEAIEAAEADGWAEGVWDPLAESGFPLVGIDEDVGGSGGDLEDLAEVLRQAGAHAAPVPVAEQGLAAWLVVLAGLPLPEGVLTVVPGSPGDTLSLSAGGLSGTAHLVPWARRADHVVALVDGFVVAAPASGLDIIPRTNLAGEPRDTVTFDGVAAETATSAVESTDLRRRGALTRALLMAGALDRMSRLTVEYTNERHQFGRPVARFQAVQQHLVWAAQDAAIANMAAQAAARQAGRGPAAFEIAAAKLIANQCATSATRACHQAHGAMGMTREYGLHHLSRRLWAWRAEYGTEHEWSTWLGRAAADLGPDQLYPLITAGSLALV
jgi:acyl-CoA dehydrogenase